MADQMPSAGEQAPDFEGPTQNGDTLRLSDQLAADDTRAVLVYFYPKDDTPGCTKQACNLRDNLDSLQKEGVQVIGISGDAVDSHAAFADKYQLNFPLVADPEHHILNKYGVYGEKSFYGKKLIGIKRTSFLIGRDGKVIHVFKKPNTSGHAEEVLRKLPAAD